MNWKRSLSDENESDFHRKEHFIIDNNECVWEVSYLEMGNLGMNYITLVSVREHILKCNLMNVKSWNETNMSIMIKSRGSRRRISCVLRKINIIIIKQLIWSKYETKNNNN